MKKHLFILLIAAVLATLQVKAQTNASEAVTIREGFKPPPPKFSKDQHVFFSYRAHKDEDGNGVLEFTFQIEEGWRLYAATQKKGVPVKTVFTFQPSDKYQVLGPLGAPYPTLAQDKTLKMDVAFYEHTVTFVQKLKLTPGGSMGHGQIIYMIGKEGHTEKPIKQDFAYMIM
ncbi:MAG TPA: protein-disulfide reductase DsbD domain-containing protein [Chitinophaga sp.]